MTDGKTDPAVYRDGTWFLFLSTGTFTGIQFGTPTDIPAPESRFASAGPACPVPMMIAS